MYIEPCYAGFPTPLGQSFYLTVVGNVPVISSIVRLINSRGPFTVFWKIAKIVVEPLNRKTFWWMPHVCKKVFKYHPPVAHMNTSSAVIFESFIARVMASLNHPVPPDVHRCVSKTVGSVSSDSYFRPKATTRLFMTGSNISWHGWSRIPAVTLTQPLEILSDAFVFDGCQPSKSEAGYDVGVFHFSSPEKHPMEIARQSGVSLMFGFDGLAALFGVYHKPIGVSS